MSRILSFQYSSADETADADQIRCAAFEYAASLGAVGVCLVLVSLPERSEPIQVVANLNANEASIVLPLFDWANDVSFGTAFGLSDAVYIVSDHADHAAMQQAASVFAKNARLNFFSLDRSSASISGFVFRPEDKKWVPLSRSAEGAAAAAMVLHSDLINGTMESTVEQSGGVLEVGLRKENGKVLGLSVGGPVEVRK